MRILLVVDSLEVGGAERHVVDLARALHAVGHRIVVACARTGPLSSELESAGIQPHVLMRSSVKRRVDLIFAARLRGILRGGEFDLVHAHLYASTAAASLAVLGTELRFVTTVHSEMTWQGTGARLVSGLMYRHASAVIAVSSSIARQLIGHHHIPLSRVDVIPNALYLPESSPEGGSLTLSLPGPVVGVIARLHREKGVDVFLDAMRRLVSGLPNIQAVVIGGGPEGPSLKRHASTLGLDRHVRFMGPAARARDFIPSFDLLVVPSRSEGSPLVVLEAMAVGVAVVATRVGGVPNQIRDGLDGLLVPSESPRDMADAIHALLTAPEWRTDLALEARRRLALEFPYSAVLRRIEAVYASALTAARIGDELTSADAKP